jgi:methenyltetrahydromethanopterin cyclohydrolase
MIQYCPQSLNKQALVICNRLIQRQTTLRVQLHDDGVAVPTVDCGIDVSGSLEAGLMVAEICMSGLGTVSMQSSSAVPYPIVRTTIDQPFSACLLSQYAGWMIRTTDYSAMGSGPMRAAAAKESLFESVSARVDSSIAVGVLESRQLPPPDIQSEIAADCRVDPRGLTLLVAPTASLVGAIQIVARSVETAMHKLLELGFDVTQVKSGFGTAPLPPVGGQDGRDDMVAMGRTNDAILYGGEVTLWCDSDDDTLETVVPLIPSSASDDYGRPFAEIFAAYDHDFYQIDKRLFSPAAIALVNLRSGRVFRAGQINQEILHASFEA